MSIGSVMRVGMAGSALMVLSGCLGSETPPVEPTFLEEARTFVDVGTQLDGVFNTAFKGMPITGTARYNGQSGLVLTSAAGDDFLLLGNAAMLADFQNGTMDGTFGSFRGVILPGGAGPAGAETDYAGTIVLANGAIGVARPNDFDGDFSGSLTGGGNVIIVSGDLLGDFKGTPIRGVIGSSGAGGLIPPTGTINGLPASNIVLEFWAK